ncbi:MAG: sensor histidine kinase [Proteobacteria bacterium]|nr:sensor histidine kinase [Pseudomonadota bacterium]
MAGWSLRTKLVAAVGVAIAPVIALAAWSTRDEIVAVRAAREETMSASLERAVARYRELIEGSRRLVAATCSADIARKPIGPAATKADADACGAYLSDVVRQFPGQYAGMMVTDQSGTARCSTAPTDVGMNFADREIFRLVRENDGVSIGIIVAGRAASRAVIPIAVPIVVDGRFGGMCSVNVSFQSLADSAAVSPAVPVVLIDGSGATVGGDAQMSFSLPVAARLAAAIADGRSRFNDYGRDGRLCRFFIAPLAGQALFAVAVMPMTSDLSAILHEFGRFGLIALAGVAVLIVTWFGADRWCVRPLRYIGDFAGRVARGEDVRFEPLMPWTKELVIVGDGVRRMAEAIISREDALKAGLEQRDHMLREIHHRVKNNLQMISSLLNLQAAEIRSPRIRRFFGDAQNRVLALSILHRHLYERSSWSLVDFQQFISDLVRQISVPRPGIERPSVRYHIRAPIMAVGPDTAIPIGLIVTEVVGCALTHDFSAVASPEIRIDATEKGGGRVEFVIEDNGFDPAGPALHGSFSQTLIRGLAMQLGGEACITAREGGGTRVVVSFPMPGDGKPDV